MLVAQNEIRDVNDRQHANDQALATELNRYQDQIQLFRNGFYFKLKKIGYFASLYHMNHINPDSRNENDQLKNELSMKAIQVEDMLQQTQQADTQKDLQLNEKVAQNAQLQQKIEVLQTQMRNRGTLFMIFEFD